MLHSVYHLLSRPPEAYLIVWAVSLGDAVVPVLPSETVVITAGLLCVVGDLSLGWVIAAAALGAFCGDTISYCLGRYVGGPFQRRFLEGDRATRALGWARGQLDTRGGSVLIVARYVPGGRTAATFTCGLTRYPWGKLLAFDAVAVLSWALYASLIGYFGGRFFHTHAWLALLVAFAFAGTITLLVELVRRLRR